MSTVNAHEYLRGLVHGHDVGTVTLRMSEAAALLGEYDAARTARTGNLHVVTLRYPGTPGHNPQDKRTGACPLSPECTDLTGAHHSTLVDDAGLVRLATDESLRITRAERVELPEALR